VCGITTFHSLRRFRERQPGETVEIHGVGGLGHFGLAGVLTKGGFRTIADQSV